MYAFLIFNDSLLEDMLLDEFEIGELSSGMLIEGSAPFDLEVLPFLSLATDLSWVE